MKHVFTLLFLCLSISIDALSQSTVTIGTTASGSNAAQSLTHIRPTPPNYSRQKSFFRLADYTNAGGTKGYVSKIRWYKSNLGKYFDTSGHIRIYMYKTTASALSNPEPWMPTNATGPVVKVYESSTIAIDSTIGWKEFVLDTVFYVGESNFAIMVEIAQNASTTLAPSWEFAFSFTGSNSFLSSTTGFPSTLNLNTNRPRVQFEVLPGCYFPFSGGNTIASDSTICPNSQISLSLSENYEGAHTFLWQQSTDSINWSTTAGTTRVIAKTVTSDIWFRCKISCDAAFAYSKPVKIISRPNLVGTYTINNTIPKSATNYTSFKEAINELNCGRSGNVILEVPAGSVFYEKNLEITARGSFSVIIKKTGVGPNPKIFISGTSASEDVGITLSRVQNLIIDGIDVLQGGNSPSNYIEIGYLLSGGCSNVQVKNLFISIADSIGVSTYGVRSYGGSAINSSCRFINNIILNCSYGYYMTGLDIDQNGEISADTLGKAVIYRTIPGNRTLAGIFLKYQSGYKISNVIVKDIAAVTNTVSKVYGIYSSESNGILSIRNSEIYNITSSFEAFGIYNQGYRVQIVGNKIHHVKVISDTSSLTASGLYLVQNSNLIADSIVNNKIYAISNSTLSSGRAVGINFSNYKNLRVFNNLVYDIKAPYSSSTGSSVAGIHFQNSQQQASHYIYHNTIYIDDTSSKSNYKSIALFVTEATTTSRLYYISNNIIENNSYVQAGAIATAFMINSYSMIDNSSNNNIYFVNNSNTWNRIIYYSQDFQFKKFSQYKYYAFPIDSSSYFAHTTFLSGGLFSVDPHAQNVCESGGKNLGSLLPYDISYRGRGPYPLLGQKQYGGKAPDIGAEEGDFTALVSVSNCVDKIYPNNSAQNVTNKNLILQWSDTSQINNARGYDVYFGTTSNPVYIGRTFKTYYEIPNLQQNQKYFWRVIPVDTRVVTSCPVDSFTTNFITINNISAEPICGLFRPSTLRASSNKEVVWYSDTTSAPVYVGNSYVTPDIKSTKQYYVAARELSTGMQAGINTQQINTVYIINTNQVGEGLLFDALSDLILDTVTIKVQSTAVGTVTIDLKNAALATMQSYTFNVSTIGTNLVKVPINFYVPAGRGYRIVFGTISTGIRFHSTSLNNSSVEFPFMSGSLMLLNSVWNNGLFTRAYYHGFYSINYRSVSITNKQPVSVMYTVATSINTSFSSVNICEGDSIPALVSSSNANYKYTWRPVAGLSKSTGNSVIIKPRNTITYIVRATDSITGCIVEDTLLINVAPKSSAGIASFQNCSCPSRSTKDTLKLVGYVGSITWQKLVGTVWVDETGPGANNSIYPLPNSIPNQFYRAKVISPNCTFYSNILRTLDLATPPPSSVRIGNDAYFSDYSSLTGAGGIFDAINCSGMNKNVNAVINSDVLETAMYSLNDKNNGYRLTISSDTGKHIISGKSALALIRFDGADSVAFDGTSANRLTFRNDSSGHVFYFINAANHNKISGCTILTKGAQSAGVFFGSTNKTTGNNFNEISFCNISSVGKGSFIKYGIVSNGNANVNLYNKSNTIYRNNISRVFVLANESFGVGLLSNNSDWNIIGNHFFQPDTIYLTGTLSSYMKSICVAGSTGSNFRIDSNYIGGSSFSTMGEWVVQSETANVFNESISFNSAASGNDYIRNNVIRNFNLFVKPNGVGNGFAGIVIASKSNMEIRNNTIGDLSNDSSIKQFITGTNATNVRGISITADNADIVGNTIAGIKAQGNTTSTGSTIYGIITGTAQTGTIRIDSNFISSIRSNRMGEHIMIYTQGVSSNSSANIQYNSISNITVDNLVANIFGGIFKTGAGKLLVSNNRIRDLDLITKSGNNYLYGIYSTCNDSSQNIEFNQIHNLKIIDQTSSALHAIYLSNASAKFIVQSNKIYNLENTSVFGRVVGIHNGLQRSSDVINNSISIIPTTNTTNLTVNGIAEAATTNSKCNYFNNTVLIGGYFSALGSLVSCAYHKQSSATVQHRNNIYVNIVTSESLSYGVALRMANPNLYTGNNNFFYALDSSKVLYIGAPRSLSQWQTQKGGGVNGDGNSMLVKPNFVSNTQLIPTVFNCNLNNKGASLINVPTDIDNKQRGLIPDVGAYEFTPISQINLTAGKLALCGLKDSTWLYADFPYALNLFWYRNGIPIGQFKDSIKINTGGNYHAEFKSENCTLTSNTISVTQHNLPTVILGNDTSICKGELFKIVAGNSVGQTYLWSTGDTTSFINVVDSGRYSVLVTNQSGCSASGLINVSINSKPILNLGPDQIVCENSFKVIDAGNPGCTYLWNTGDTTASIIIDTTGTYIVEVTNANGCKTLDTIFVESVKLPIVFLGNDTSICDGETCRLGGNVIAKKYSWNTGDTTQIIDVKTSGSYILNAWNEYGCQSTDTVNIQFKASPTANLGPDKIVCENSYTVIDAGNPGCTYLWNTGDTTASITIGSTGTYVVEVTNANGCKTLDTIFVESVKRPIVFLGNDTSICEGETWRLGGNVIAKKYLWNTGDTTQTIDVKTSGSYILNTWNEYGCQSTDTISIQVRDLPTAMFSYSSNGYVISFEAKAQNGVSYLWNFGDGSLPESSANPVHQYSNHGEYKVTLQTINIVSGCDSLFEQSIKVNPLGVPNTNIKEIQLQAYPNPFGKELNIVFDVPQRQEVKMIIYDVYGRALDVLIDNKVLFGKQNVLWKNENIRDGVYFLSIYMNGKIYNMKVVSVY